MKGKRCFTLTLALAMLLTTAACSTRETADAQPLTTAVPVSTDSNDTFYQELTHLISERPDTSGGFSTQSAQGNCRVLVWTDKPFHAEALEPDTVLSHSCFHVLQFTDQNKALAALDSLNAQGITASLDRTWTSTEAYSTGAVQISGGSLSWGVGYSGLSDYANCGTFQNQVTVGILDSGIDFEHSYLSGHVDKTRSINLSSDTGLDDENGHGTHVAGIIVDATQTAPVKLVSVKTQDREGNGTDSSLVAGLLYAMEQEFDVVNLSLGGGHSDVVDEAIQCCLQHGLVIVASSGNDGAQISPSEHCPAHIQDILVVGACSPTGELAYFSNYGDSVDLLAPGLNINSSIPGNGWAVWSGTSMAAPFASAAAALLLCQEDMTPAQVEATLKTAVNEKGVLDMRLLLPEDEPEEPAPEAVPETSPEPVVEPTPEPVSELTPEPAVEPVQEPAPEVVPEETMPDPVDEPAQAGSFVTAQEYRYLGQSCLYTGQWSDGRPDGQGRLSFSGSGGQFRYLDGTWENGLFTQGTGEEPLSDGSVYVGGVARVMMGPSSYAILWHGSGRFNLAGGDWTETVYDMGELVSTIYHTKDGQTFSF